MKSFFRRVKKTGPMYLAREGSGACLSCDFPPDFSAVFRATGAFSEFEISFRARVRSFLDFKTEAFACVNSLSASLNI